VPRRPRSKLTRAPSGPQQPQRMSLIARPSGHFCLAAAHRAHPRAPHQHQDTRPSPRQTDCPRRPADPHQRRACRRRAYSHHRGRPSPKNGGPAHRGAPLPPAATRVAAALTSPPPHRAQATRTPSAPD
jgi:hypothetical protein